MPGTPLTLVPVDEFTAPVLAPGTKETADQSVFARALQALLNRTEWLANHKQDTGGGGDVPSTDYVNERVRQVRNVKKTAGGGGTTYTVSATDEVIEAVTAAGTLTLNLQCYANFNTNLLTVVDQGKNAAVNNIILHPETGKSINGGTAGANLNLTASGGSWSIWRLADGSGYWVTGPV